MRDDPPSPWPAQVLVTGLGRLYGPSDARQRVEVPAALSTSTKTPPEPQSVAISPPVRRDDPDPIRYPQGGHGDGGSSLSLQSPLMPHRRAVLSVLSVLAVLVVLSAALPALAQPPDPSAAARADYDLLQRWRFRAEPIAVPAGGVRWSDEGGSWTLESGKIWLQEPTSAGAVTGLVFEGKGRFQMAVPDPIELAQLRRFAQKPELSAIDEPFSALVLRTAGPLPLQGVDVPPARGFEVNKLARDRHQHWHTQRILDAHPRIVQAFLNPHHPYLRLDMLTTVFTWLT